MEIGVLMVIVWVVKGRGWDGMIWGMDWVF